MKQKTETKIKELLCVDCWNIVALTKNNLVAFGEDDYPETICHKQCNDGNEDTGTLISPTNTTEIIRYAKDKIELQKEISHNLSNDLGLIRDALGFSYVYELNKLLLKLAKRRKQHKKFRIKWVLSI